MKYIDKLYHFTAGVIIYILFNVVLNNLLAMVPVIIIGGSKEIYDWYSGKGTPDWWDFIWTILGGIFVLLLSI